ncbi:MAG: tRNA pseudouridine(13) synthase TruD [Pseudomonadales bacterium]
MMPAESASECLALAYGAPEAEGRYRVHCDDFCVVERSLPAAGQGEHEYLLVEKVGANTAWIAERLAEHAGVEVMAVGHAGRKDRHAKTTQAFTIHVGLNTVTDWSTWSLTGAQIIAQSRTLKKLRPGDHLGNRFTLVLRDVRGDLAPRLERIREQGFPNYFGPQRFGRDGQNLVDADAFLQGAKRPRHTRSLLLSAARSQLFNEYLSRKIATDGWNKVQATDVGPLFGRSRDPQLGEAELDIRGARWLKGLVREKVSASVRSLRTVPETLAWRVLGEGCWELDFGLPPGSYATSLLREVLIGQEGHHA